MEAQTLNCPMCGAAQSTDATQCEHCGARLATVACPSCFGLVFLGSKFCSHCGAKVDRVEVAADAKKSCPRCKVELSAVKIGGTDLCECPRCEGVWVGTDALQKICADREQQSAVLGMAISLPVNDDANPLEEKIRYLPCPQCATLMNRVNFAHCSHVIVDVCNRHGTWFDRDELRRIGEFIRAGGFEKAREREISELESKRNELKSTQIADAWKSPKPSTDYSSIGREIGLSAAAAVLKFLFNK